MYDTIVGETKRILKNYLYTSIHKNLSILLKLFVYITNIKDIEKMVNYTINVY